VNNPGLIGAKEGIANCCIFPRSCPELAIGKHNLASPEISQLKKGILFLLPVGNPSGLSTQVPAESVETKVVSKPRWSTADTSTGFKEQLIEPGDVVMDSPVVARRAKINNQPDGQRDRENSNDEPWAPHIRLTID